MHAQQQIFLPSQQGVCRASLLAQSHLVVFLLCLLMLVNEIVAIKLSGSSPFFSHWHDIFCTLFFGDYSGTRVLPPPQYVRIALTHHRDFRVFNSCEARIWICTISKYGALWPSTPARNISRPPARLGVRKSTSSALARRSYHSPSGSLTCCARPVRNREPSTLGLFHCDALTMSGVHYNIGRRWCPICTYTFRSRPTAVCGVTSAIP
ncbi:hypothetical protein R3P38DRAFT_2820590 [Favolaschia claudopus]|uniref:Secreted protein n=1 Tax=Favolaschia claudopus TaxID=2862362 RepID=A0AAW0EGV4_9AGAR